MLSLCGWLSLLVVAFSALAESTGLLDRWLERSLSRRLGRLGTELEIGRLDVQWLNRTVRLEDVSLGPGGEDIYLERLDVLLGWSARHGPTLERAEVHGGNFRVTYPLLDAIRALVAERRAETRSEGPFPTLAVHDFRVALNAPEWGDLEFGRIDACLRPGAEGQPRLAGRLLPPGPGASTGVVYLSGQFVEDDLLEVRAAARGLPVHTAWLPESEELAGVRELDPRGVCELEAHARYRLGQSLYPEIDAHIVLREGSALLPWVRSGPERVENVAAVLRARFTPEPDERPLERDAWSVRGSVEARWNDTPLRGWLVSGRDAGEPYLAEAWVNVPALAIGPDVGELLRHPYWLEQTVQPMVEPEGEIAVQMSARLGRDWLPGASAKVALHRAFAIRPTAHASAAYHGHVDSSTGRRDMGFPLRLHGLRGEVLYTYDPRPHLAEAFGVFGLTGTSEIGDAEVEVSMHRRPRWLLRESAPEWMAYKDLYVRAASPSLRIGPELEEAFRGLAGLVPPEELWELYQPSEGTLGFELELWSNARAPELASRLDVDVDAATLAWAPFPLPLADVRGRVSLLTDGQPPEERTPGWSLGVELQAEHEAFESPLTLSGHVQGDPAEESAVVSHFDAQVRGVNLRETELREVIARSTPALAEALHDSRAAGFVDLTMTRSQAMPSELPLAWAEVEPSPGAVEAVPERFPMPTRDIEGRAIAVAEFPDEAPAGEVFAVRVETRLEPVVGNWGGSGRTVPVAVRGTFPPAPGVPAIDVFGAGIDVSNRALLGSVAGFLTEGPEAREVDLLRVDVRGEIDFSAHVRLVDEPGEGLEHLAGHLRSATLGAQGTTLLSSVDGRLDYDGDVLTAERLRAMIGLTPMEIEGLRLKRDEESTRLRSHVTVRGLPLDFEHLRSLFDEDLLRDLLERFGWRGRVDVEDGLVEMTWIGEDQEPSVRFRGRLRLANMFIDLGLPVSVGSAELAELDLAVERGTVRALARVRDLYGEVAGRRLERARLLVSLVQPHLLIQDLDGVFGGGRLRSMGLESAAGAEFFSLDLRPPFPFRLSMDMLDVDLGELLEGIFSSGFANEGRLLASLFLEGDVEHLTGITGWGSAAIEESSLWAIPVFQALFSQLGFDTTAIFTSMVARFEIEDGVVQLPHMRMKSDLLSLVGKGELDFDGGLHADLEVRYSLVDRLGPLTRLLYKIQNSLLRVSIRGDMSRPKVVLRGILSQFLRNVREGPPELPLPGTSALPARF